MAKEEVIEILSSPEKEENGTPIRPILCLKSKIDMEKYEEVEDCFILEFDPSDSIDFSKLSIKTENDDNAADLTVIAEKGQVACRDYPHSRHLCLKFPFDTTPHKSYCEQCYCYACDSAAPCKNWFLPSGTTHHCDASDKMDFWRNLRTTNQVQKQKPLLQGAQ